MIEFAKDDNIFVIDRLGSNAIVSRGVVLSVCDDYIETMHQRDASIKGLGDKAYVPIFVRHYTTDNIKKLSKDKGDATMRYSFLSHADFGKMTVDEIKLNITARIKQLEITLKP